MGLFEKIFPKTSVNVATNGYFQTLTAYAPVFHSFSGGIYEAEICRAAIHSFANQCAKLKPEVEGASRKGDIFKDDKPNDWQNTFQFLYRVATILECENTVFIVPVRHELSGDILGIYPICPSMCELRQDKKGEAIYKFSFPNGKIAFEYAKEIGVMTKFQYKNDFFGSQTNPLRPTLDLIEAQNQGIIEGVKSSASVRFMAKLAQTLKPKDIEDERKRFVNTNLSNGNGGVMIFDPKYAEIKQIESKPFVVDEKQMEIIKTNVFNYFSTNENIIKNKFSEDEWNAYYEGKIEPFAIQLSMVLTGMIYSDTEVSYGNRVVLTANRLQYASNTTKLNIVTQLFDRGLLTANQGLEIFNMPKVEDGDKRYIRKEYAEVNKLDEIQMKEVQENDI